MGNRRRKVAAALRYEPEAGGAPEVVATGYGEVAERIIRAAKEHSIPMHRDADLASVLVGLELNREVPVELYRAVAAVLAVVLELDK